MTRRLTTLPPRVQMLGASRVSTERGNANERGYDYRWQKARESFLRNHPLCVMCQAEGKVQAATVVDHIIPHKGDELLFWRESNWQPLCATHHSGAKQRMERGAG